jgi:hypothetical protein
VSDWLGGLAYWHYLLFFCLPAEVDYFRKTCSIFLCISHDIIFHIVYFLYILVCWFVKGTNMNGWEEGGWYGDVCSLLFCGLFWWRDGNLFGPQCFT